MIPTASLKGLLELAMTSNEEFGLWSLVERLNNRYARPLAPRLQRCGTKVYRDPRDVAWRWLKRFVGGYWYRGGSHVARLHAGAGIGFLGWVNDRRQKIKPLFMPGIKVETRFVLVGTRKPSTDYVLRLKDRMTRLDAAKWGQFSISMELFGAIHRRMVQVEDEMYQAALGTRNKHSLAIIPYAGGDR